MFPHPGARGCRQRGLDADLYPIAIGLAGIFQLEIETQLFARRNATRVVVHCQL